VRPDFRCDYSRVVARLGDLARAPTPLEKLHVVRDASLLVHACVEAALEAAGRDLSDVEMGADDTLPVMAWIVLQLHMAGEAARSGGAGGRSGGGGAGAGAGAGAAASPPPKAGGASGTPGAAPTSPAAASPPPLAAALPAPPSPLEGLAADLPAHFAFVQRFHVPGAGELERSLLGYRLANAEQAVNYFLEGEGAAAAAAAAQ
jgi:hypothetical protein